MPRQPIWLVVFPGHADRLSTPSTTSSSSHSAETKQVLSMLWLWCRKASASLEHIYQVPIRMGWSCCQSSPPSLLSISLLPSLVLGQWLFLTHVRCLVVASLALTSSALFQPIMPGVNAGVSTWVPRVMLQFFYSILFRALRLRTHNYWTAECPYRVMTGTLA